MKPHICHAAGCNVPVPPQLLMCDPHWFMVPAKLRREVWRHYRPGQERDKEPSAVWREAADNAIAAVAAKEDRCPAQ